MPTEQTNIAPGEIIHGKVQGITKFGAFIELPGGAVGLVHISEIADTYVKDVNDFLKEGDEVTVKVLNVAGKKIGLSIKKALKPEPKPNNRDKPQSSTKPSPKPKPRSARSHDQGSQGGSKVTLDDKIAKFFKESDERMQPLKNKVEPKRRSKGNKNSE
ncbi:RNA binding protein, contains ribosomal protein S1 domain [Candidatus Syntrophocurvum alkaliphilum]|uniref:RNA binding protein, contains ribosomal protein S1 domain n=1 Tax=Candidatus Syntrophocurvum alkaliphilum TaxID=2293317 RepID=A0A6I6DMU5_9FIRM|nr:S1 RNA-binding domain-containing protein [Candidatus Syntrophocurvum alkaliphilum]QGU00521.1 RNA binding protein, contains ribosomal protein S1 domain [Candidatus Syntrophocurvum alkaliphilum]